MPPMSDHDTWNMFFGQAFAGYIAAQGDWTMEQMLSYARVDADALLAESKKREPAEPEALSKVHEAIDDYVDALVARKNGITALDRAFDLICYALGRSPSAEMDAKRSIVSEAGVTK